MAHCPPPGAQGLAEILVVLVQPHAGRYIEEAEHAEGGVEQNATGVDTGIADLALQQIVGQHDHIAEIAEHVTDAVFDEPGVTF